MLWAVGVRDVTAVVIALLRRVEEIVMTSRSREEALERIWELKEHVEALAADELERELFS